jgi:putative transposase
MTKSNYKSINHCVYLIRYHLVLVIKYRKPVIDSAILKRLKVLTHERVDAWNGEVIEINGEPDHLHILFELPPNHAISDFVNALKTGTSRRIKKEFEATVRKYLWKEAFWSRSYCIVSCGGAPLTVVKQYLENQKGA